MPGRTGGRGAVAAGLPGIAAALVAVLAAALAGLVSGVAAVLTHTSWPWLALGVAAAVTALWWLPAGPRLVFAGGWAVAVARASLTRPEGDYLVSDNAQGWTLLAFSVVVVVGALAGTVAGAGRVRDPRIPGPPS